MLRLTGPKAAAVLGSLVLAACNGVSLKPVELEYRTPGPKCPPTLRRSSVDILFVIDNSSSMGPAQAKLAADFDVFIDALESSPIEIDYRIGVTTTDNGNPWCPGGTPEAGNLVLESCKNRLAQPQPSLKPTRSANRSSHGDSASSAVTTHWPRRR